MSRLFESFGDDADDEMFSESPASDTEAAEEIAVPDAATSLLDDVDLGEPLATAPAPDAEAPPDAPGAKREPPPTEYDIPNFVQDERDRVAYDDAKRRHIRSALAAAETAIQASYKTKREVLIREVNSGKTFEEERRASAMHTTRQYATQFPNRVDKRGINPPSFMENLFSFGGAGRLYRAALNATNALDQLRTAMRKREDALEALESQMKRALALKEESIKKAVETEAGLADFHRRPEIAAIYKRTLRAQKERADYAKRLERGGVSDEEQRDRGMAEHQLVYLELPMMGAIIARVRRFGKLSYFQLRDLNKKEALLSYDPRLDPLRNSVFDVYAVAGVVAAKLKRNDNGTAFRVADHFKACWRNQEEAEERYGQHRAALRGDRGLPRMTPRDANEAEILDRLATLASQIDVGQSGAAMPPGAAIAPRP